MEIIIDNKVSRSDFNNSDRIVERWTNLQSTYDLKIAHSKNEVEYNQN